MVLGERIGLGRTAEVFAWGDDRVLKLFFDWMPADVIEREATIGGAVAVAGLPAPRVFGLETVENRQGIVYERVCGELMQTRIMRRPWRVMHLAREMAAIHAQVHAAALDDALPAQREHLQWAINATDALDDAARAAVLSTLDRLPDGEVVCHGDLHPENVMLTARGPVVIDWLNASRGHALADVARTVVMIAWGGGSPNDRGSIAERVLRHFRVLLLDAYVRHYCQLAAVTRAEIEAWLVPVMAARLRENIPGERAVLLREIKRRL